MEFSVGIGAFVLPPDGIIHQVRKGDMAPTLREIGVGFVSLHEALDFTTPMGRALAGMLAAFVGFEREILRERVKAGIGKPGDAGSGTGGRRSSRITPRPCGNSLPHGLSKAAIAQRVGSRRAWVRRLL
jgi:putative DNA-invertase from lambdoid prophage Rac